MSYPRKRALLACDFCRQRKRRCDGRKPICGNCAEAEADCHYQELPIQRLMSGNLPSAMAKRLERIESLLKVHSDAIASLQSSSSSSDYSCSTATPASASNDVQLQQQQQQQLAALEQSHEDIEHDIPAVLTYLATSGQHHNYSHGINRATPVPDGGIRKASTYHPKLSHHIATPNHLREHKLAHVPSPPNSTSSAASATASVTGSSPQLQSIAPASTTPDIPKPGMSTSSLLSFPTLKSLLGEFPEDYFFRIEIQRASAATANSIQPVELPYLNRDVTDLLVTTFFSVVHPSHPLFLRRELFFNVYEKVVARGLAHDSESALCLIVFALGVIASSSPGCAGSGVPTTPTTQRGNRKGVSVARDANVAGMEYFLPAQQIMIMLDGLTFTGDLMLAQGLILGAIYLAYVGQPVKSWKLVHQAGKQLQLLTMSQKSPQNNDDVVQAACACYSLESDLYVEFSLPTSGITQFIDSIFLSRPTYSFHDGRADSDESAKWSEVSIQRIMNRAHDALYSPSKTSQPFQPTNQSPSSVFPQQPSSLSLPSMLSIAADFERQLAVWYDSFAPNIQPGLGPQPTNDDRGRTLRLRYHEAQIVILKPFLLFLASSTGAGGNASGETLPSSDLTHVVFDKAQACVESCRLYIQTAAEMLKKPARHTWSTCQISLNAVLLCTITSMSSCLSHLVPDVAELQQLVMDGASAWAVPESSSEAGIWIIADIGRRQRFCLGA